MSQRPKQKELLTRFKCLNAGMKDRFHFRSNSYWLLRALESVEKYEATFRLGGKAMVH